MNKIKVYNEHGQFIDCVTLPDGVSKIDAYTELNKNGRFVKAQFNKRMTKVTHSYADFKPVRSLIPNATNPL